MDAKMLHSAIRQCEADCNYIEKLLANLLAQSKPLARRPPRIMAPDQSLRRLLSRLDEPTFDFMSDFMSIRPGRDRNRAA